MRLDIISHGHRLNPKYALQVYRGDVLPLASTNSPPSTLAMCTFLGRDVSLFEQHDNELLFFYGK